MGAHIHRSSSILATKCRLSLPLSIQIDAFCLQFLILSFLFSTPNLLTCKSVVVSRKKLQWNILRLSFLMLKLKLNILLKIFFLICKRFCFFLKLIFVFYSLENKQLQKWPLLMMLILFSCFHSARWRSKQRICY